MSIDSMLDLAPGTLHAYLVFAIGIFAFQFVLTSFGRNHLGGQFETPVAEAVDLDNIKDHKVDERDSKDGNTPRPAAGGHIFAFTKDTVHGEEKGKDLSEKHADSEEPVRHVFPPEARHTGWENDEMRG